MYCSNCGREVSSNSRFCGNCGKPIFEKRHIEEVIEEEQENTVEYNRVAFIISIVSVVLGFLAFVKEITYVGIAVGIVSLFMIISVLIKNKKNKVRNVRNLYTLSLSIVGVITNSIWLFFLTEILPNL